MFLLLLGGVSLLAQPRQLSESGLLLIGEMGCLNCHPGGPELHSRSGPVLTGASAHYDDRHVPSFAKLTGAGRQAIGQLLASSPFTAMRPMPAGDAGRGQRLFGQVGCAACHDNTFRVRNYAPGRLAAFLIDPLSARPSGRMPRIPLTEQEAADIAAHLSDGAEPQMPPPSRTGAKLFVSTGCANCHQLENIAAELKAPRLSGSSRGCMAPQPPGNVPDFRLTRQQRESIQAAIREVQAGDPFDPGRALRLRLQSLGCLRCHARDGQGGPDTSHSESFTALEDTDLGDEGRLPPPLTAIGYKLTPEALRAALRGETHVHPKMAVRMPDYGEAVAADLARRFTALDLPRDFQAVERTGRNIFGRQLAGINGLGCINCHHLRGRKSLGIGASDLALAPRRLRVEWFRDFLMNPSRFHPTTRMPSFWPNGKAVAKNVLRGDSARQIDSIWVYLLEIDQTRLPDGMEEKGAFELKPAGTPIILRAFIKNAGTHAIAVGFPEGVHAAFDAYEVRWALAWRGRFLDAEGVWEDRFNPPLSPLGTDVIALNFPRPFGGETADDRFGGYRLDAGGVPAFLYESAGAKISDRLAPGGKGFVRTVEIRGLTAPRSFQAAAGNRIVKDGETYVVDGRLRIRLSGSAVIRQAPGGMELMVELPAGDSTIREEMEW
ncbi:MAG: hypothetical protein SFV51_10890 [Bryobacteraceae bacterium]|nr:hypothetical protein [Bryobacteraceae bacterium]